MYVFIRMYIFKYGCRLDVSTTFPVFSITFIFDHYLFSFYYVSLATQTLSDLCIYKSKTLINNLLSYCLRLS